jgi:hypothetical protein
MAENPKFNNIGMFKDVTNNTGHTDIDVDNKSEVLATQGNVINSIKTFWNKLRKKLVYAITRENINNAYGDNHHPVYVNSDGIVEVCNPNLLTGTVTNTNNNINLDEINPLYPGQIVCIKVTNNNTNNTSFLKINNTDVYYPTGVQVKVSDVSNDTYLFTFISGNGDKWILNNKINVASDFNSGLMTKEQFSKLNGIEEGANYFTYTLPTASANKKGGVKSSSNNDSDNNRKIYHVGVDTNGIMTVNVPWQNTHNNAALRVSNTSNGTQNSAATNGSMYLKIVDGDNVSSLKISGSGSTNVTSNSNGEITIESPTVTTYNRLDISNNDDSKNYVIKGPGEDNATINYYLAGNGSWQRGILVPIPTEEGKTLKSRNNGTVYWG